MSEVTKPRTDILCPERRSKWWPFHSWKMTVVHPSILSDGAGDCWGGEAIQTCRLCGQQQSLGFAFHDLNYGPRQGAWYFGFKR